MQTQIAVKKKGHYIVARRTMDETVSAAASGRKNSPRLYAIVYRCYQSH